MAWNGRNESILGSKPIVATTVVDAALSGLGEAATVERTSSSSTSTIATSVAEPSNNTAPPPTPPPATKAPLVNAWSRPLIKKDAHHEEGKDAIVEKIAPLVLDGESSSSLMSSSDDKNNRGVALTATPSPSSSSSLSPLGGNEDKKTFSPKNTTAVIATSKEEGETIVVVEVIPPLPPPPKLNAWGRKDNNIIRKQQDEQQAKEKQQRQAKEQDEATNSTVSTAGSFSDAVDTSIGNNALDDPKDAEVSHITTPSVLEGNTVVTATNAPSTLAGMAVEDVVVVECSSPTPPPSDISSSDNQQQQQHQPTPTTTETRKNNGGKKKNKNKSSSVVVGNATGNSNNGSSIDGSNGNHTNSGWGTKNYKKNHHNGGHQQHHNNHYQSNHHHQHQSSRRNNPSTTTHFQQQHQQQHPSQYAPLQQRAGYRHPPTTTWAYNNNNNMPPTAMMMNAAAPTFVPAAKRAFDPYKAKAIQLAKEAQDHEDRSAYFGSVEMKTDEEKKVEVESKVVEEEVAVLPDVDQPFFSIDVECIATGYGSCARGINDGCGNAGRHGKDVPPFQYNDYSHRYPGRVALVDNDGNVLANIVIRPPNDGAGVTSYLTELTGLTPEICLSPDAVPLENAIRTIKALLPSNGVIVGQAIGHDVTWLGLSSGKDFDRTVDICDIFRQRLPAVLTEAGDVVKNHTESGYDNNDVRSSLLDKSSDDYLGFKTRYRHFSLRHVCLNLLGTDIQGGVHDPVTDARYSLMLFHKYRHSSPTQLRIVRDGLHRAPVTPGFAAEKTPVIDGVCVSAAGYNYKRAARKIWRWYTFLNTTRDRC